MEDVLESINVRRTRCAHCLKHLSGLLPEAQKIILVMDNLNTHCEASLYKDFAAEEACALCERLRVSLHADTREMVEHG